MGLLALRHMAWPTGHGSRAPIGQYVSDSEEIYAVSVQYDDARPAETFDADDLVETVDALRSLRPPSFVPDADCWQPADEH
jgi:hypothetical protein